jgi:hypothetical protein
MLKIDKNIYVLWKPYCVLSVTDSTRRGPAQSMVYVSVYKDTFGIGCQRPELA